ncbi:hypothetical protein V5N11_003081 [Cardamine amara subsp. amara]|uniref:Transmembrane protein n=1 Tax=Cardamine amara subsp. amara TaxID=228776 RepID=A0ABD0ZMD3_CARAN
MAAAEARAVWQRTVNRCFVQEDAKRAPKLTYLSTASTKQVEDSGSPQSSVVNPQNQSPCAGFMPLHRNPNFSDRLPHNTRLWSHHHHHPFQVNKKPLEVEVNNQVISEKKPELGAGEKQGKSFNSESFQEFIELMDTRENYGSIGFDEKKLNEPNFDPSSPWNPLSSEKAGPWWRTTDKDELASLVAQRSLDFVENCDLPTPQKMKRSYYGSPRGFDSDGFRDYSVSSQTIHEHGPSSCKKSEPDLSKSELLEALRHSQTRAREAENMAKEAYAEKEHMVKLLFKQASELFGYKQWLQLLQLETLYLQIKNKKIENNNNNKNSNEPPVSIPWSNCKARKPGKKRRNKSAKPNATKYAVGLALGMSLVGAGLLLGWTVGWMQMLSF